MSDSPKKYIEEVRMLPVEERIQRAVRILAEALVRVLEEGDGDTDGEEADDVEQ